MRNTSLRSILTELSETNITDNFSHYLKILAAKTYFPHNRYGFLTKTSDPSLYILHVFYRPNRVKIEEESFEVKCTIGLEGELTFEGIDQQRDKDLFNGLTLFKTKSNFDLIAGEKISLKAFETVDFIETIKQKKKIIITETNPLPESVIIMLNLNHSDVFVSVQQSLRFKIKQLKKHFQQKEATVHSLDFKEPSEYKTITPLFTKPLPAGDDCRVILFAHGAAGTKSVTAQYTEAGSVRYPIWTIQDLISIFNEIGIPKTTKIFELFVCESAAFADSKESFMVQFTGDLKLNGYTKATVRGNTNVLWLDSSKNESFFRLPSRGITEIRTYFGVEDAKQELIALKGDYIKAWEIIIKFPALVNTPIDEEGNTALMLATKANDSWVFFSLLVRGADITQPNIYGQTPSILIEALKGDSRNRTQISQLLTLIEGVDPISFTTAQDINQQGMIAEGRKSNRRTRSKSESSSQSDQLSGENSACHLQ